MKRLIALLLIATLMLLTPALAETAAPEDEVVVIEEAAATEEAAPSPVEKLVSLPWYTVAILIALFAAGILLSMGSKNRWTSRRIAMGAMCLAISFVLSCIVLFRMPQGGLVTPAGLLPLILFMAACGPVHGFVVGCAYGLLLLITDPYVIHPIQLLVDYPLAYGAMALGCLAYCIPSKDGEAAIWRLPLAALLAGVARYLMASLSGATFFAEYAGEQNAWIYSLGYNIAYIGPDTLVCMLAACIPGMPRLVKLIRGK